MECLLSQNKEAQAIRASHCSPQFDTALSHPLPWYIKSLH